MDYTRIAKMELKQAVSVRIVNLLKEKSMTQYQLSKTGGIPRSTVNVAILANRKSIKLDTLYEIVSTLGLTLKEFFDDPVFEDITD